MSQSAPASLSALPVILGSSSKWRAKVLRSMGVPIDECLNPDIDEYAVRVEGDDLSQPRNRSDPAALCTAVALAKSAHLLQSLPSSAPARLLLTSDQVAYFGGEVREKPRDAAQCREWFAQYAAEPIRCVTAIVVTNTATRKVYAGVEHASQLFRPTPADALHRAIERADILRCCGAFMVDDPDLAPFLATREGTEDCLMGMPSALLTRLLKEANDDAAGQKQLSSADVLLNAAGI